MSVLCRVWRRLGPRGAVLLCLAWIDVFYGTGLLCAEGPTRTQPTYAFPAEVAPLPVWGVMWLVAAVVLIVNAFRAADAAGYSTAISVKVLWGAMMLGGWIAGDIPRGYVGMSIWLAMAVVVAVCARFLPASVAPTVEWAAPGGEP